MPNPSTYFKGKFETLAPVACIIDTSLPTFAGIASTTFQTDGSAVVTWATATSTKPPVRYEIYVSPGSVTASALFVTANRVAFAPGALTSWRIFVLRDQMTYFVPGQVYTFGIRAVDAEDYSDTNTVILTATALYPNYGTLAAYVWDQLQSVHTLAGSFGKAIQGSIEGDVTVQRANNLDNLDVVVSSRVSTAHFDTVIGTPANASIAADIAEVESETDGIAAIPTNPVLTTDSRLSYLDAPISGTQTAATALSQYNTVVAGLVTVEGDIAAIPTNPVLTTDPRLNYLDIAVSSRSTQTSVDTLQTTANNIQNLVILTL